MQKIDREELKKAEVAGGCEKVCNPCDPTQGGGGNPVAP